MTSTILSKTYELLPEPAKPIAEAAYWRAVLTKSQFQYRRRRKSVPDVEPDGTNVLLLVVDCLRSDRTTIGGHYRDTTPFLDGVGRRYPDAISTAPWTYPSVPSILSGLYPHNHGAIFPEEPHNWLGDDKPRSVRGEVLTLPEWLDASGYDTFFLTSIETARLPIHRRIARPRARSHAPADELVDAALDWWDKTDRPRFGYLHFGDLHGIRTNPRQYWTGERPPFERFDESEIVDQRNNSPPSDTYVRHLKGIYDTNLRFVDAQIERLIDELDGRGDLEDTLVVVTGDHGEAMGEHADQANEWFEYPREHNGFGHGEEFFQESINVPLVLVWDDFDGTETGWVSTADVVPTVMDLLGASVEAEFDGVSLLDGHDAERAVLAEESGLGYDQFAVLQGRYKLLVSPGNDVVRLFDLESDPDERTDLSTQDGYEDVVSDLCQHLPDEKVSGIRFEVDDETMSTLEDLGYVG